MKPLLMVSVHSEIRQMVNRKDELSHAPKTFITENHSKFGKELQFEHIRDMVRQMAQFF